MIQTVCIRGSMSRAVGVGLDVDFPLQFEARVDSSTFEGANAYSCRVVIMIKTPWPHYHFSPVL